MPSSSVTAPVPSEPQEKAGARVVVLVLLGLLVLFGGAYVVAHQVAGDKVPRGTTVAGVAIGGQTEAEAARTLESELGERAAAPIPTTIDGTPREVPPADAGLSVDYEASVAEAGGSGWSPRRLWTYYTGGDELDAVVDVDEPTLTSYLETLTAEVGTEPREGAVRLRRGQIRTTKAREGHGLDPEAARSALVDTYLTDGTAELTLVPVAPEIDQADVQQALSSFANQAVSEPVSLVFDGTPVRLTPAQYTPALSMEPQDGVLVPVLDEERLARVVDDALGDDADPVPATVRIVDGTPEVVPDKPGATFDPAQVSSAFLDLVVAPSGQRSLEVAATVEQAEFTTADAEALNIKERVSTFTTYYPHADYRNVNLGRAAELVDGTLLKPGETFSLNDTVGERTRENGFTEGFIIANGIFKEDLGGGVSQMATTVFNAAFFAGLEDVEHKAHSFYIDRYPVGREATVAWGAVDLRFRNDTDHGVLVKARISPSSPSSRGSVTVDLWSTKVWDIDSRTGSRYNFTSPETRTLDTADCYPNSGYGGFDIDVTRIFRRPGSDEVVKREVIKTTYTPSDTVICRPPSGD